MIEVIDAILNNEVIEDDYNKDYIMKLNNINYKRFLNDVEQLSPLEFKNFLITNKDEIYNELNTIKSDFLYDSVIHGINHNIRVLLFAFYLGKKLELNETDFRIIMDACKYHDVGRENDLYDENHGPRSAKLIDKIVDDDIYKNDENRNLLKAIIEYHSIPDSKIDDIYSKYQLSDKERYKILAVLLKDADGLDRVRLSINNPFYSDLNPRYLRIPYSLNLVKCSHYLNSMFIDLNKNKTKQ